MQWCSSRPYRDDLFRRRYEPHVARINKLVDRLRAEHPERFIPYVAPTYGGENARVLALLQDPGPKTNPENMNGSGMLCIENVDGSAERYKMYLAKYGIDVCDIQAWNAFPWYATTSHSMGLMELLTRPPTWMVRLRRWPSLSTGFHGSVPYYFTA